MNFKRKSINSLKKLFVGSFFIVWHKEREKCDHKSQLQTETDMTIMKKLQIEFSRFS